MGENHQHYNQHHQQHRKHHLSTLSKWYIAGIVVTLVFLFSAFIRSLADTKGELNLKKVQFVIEEAGSEENNYTWTGHFNTDIDDDQLMLFMHYARVTMEKNGKVYAKYGYHTRTIGKTAGEEWACYQPAHFKETDVITIQVENVYDSNPNTSANMLFNNIYSGDKISLTKYMLQQNMIQIILACIIIVIGILMMIVITTLHSIKMKTPRGYMLCGALMVIGASCTLIDYDYISLFFGNTFIFTMFDLVMQVLIVELLLIFMRIFIHSRLFQRIADCFLLIWSIMIVIFYLLQITNIRDGFEMVNIYIITALLMVLAVIIFMVIDYHKSKDYLTGSVIYSGITVCVFTFIEMMYYFIFHSFIIVAFQFGLLIFTIVQFNVMLKYTRDGLRQMQRASTLEKELMQSRISIMLSQIQPHFLYNSLGSISQLCTEEPKKAERALDQFADFLRGNMQSLQCTKPIAFAQELTHLRNYIDLEKIRFGDRIRVSYNLEVTDFEIPALTLQPIVENSIKHGITKRREGGTVQILTRRYEHWIEIRVMDDGVGFQVSQPKNDGRNHIGMENVKNRIIEMCHGTMNVVSTPGVGTIVTITIEDKKATGNEEMSPVTMNKDVTSKNDVTSNNDVTTKEIENVNDSGNKKEER